MEANITVTDPDDVVWSFTSSTVQDSGEYICQAGNWVGVSEGSPPQTVTVEGTGLLLFLVFLIKCFNFHCTIIII